MSLKSNLKNFFSKKFVAPFAYIKRNIINTKGLYQVTEKISNTVWTHFTKSGPVLMLGVNAISVLSSHLAQIQGLKKSNRENKDYLINQEKFEMGLDLGINLVPPAYINYKLNQIFAGGKYRSRENDRKLIQLVAPIIGATKDDFYNPNSVPTIKETFAKKINEKIETVLNKNGYDKETTQGKILTLIRNKMLKILEPTRLVKRGKTLKQQTLEANNKAELGYIPLSKLHCFRNKNIHDDINGMYEGFKIMATISYMIVAGNIIMPIVKNLLANMKYKKELEEAGETRESIRRKKRFEFTKVPLPPQLDVNIKPKPRNLLDEYSNSPFDILKAPPQNNKLFSEFNSYNKIMPQSTGLRI